VSSLRMIVISMIGLTLSACGTQYWNQYAERKDTVTWSAGDAVASNSAVQVPTPWPRNSNNPNIAFDGEKIGSAVAHYRDGTNQPISKYDGPYGSKFENAYSGGGGPAAAGAPGGPPGEAATGPAGAPPPAPEAAPAPAPAPY
jgi:hypothetical protein